jgi:DNA repair exonuclease SbcCD ATPase subunit
LFELRAMPSYEILTGGHDGKRLELTGLSQRLTAPSIAALEQAWRDYGVLSNTIQAAIALRQQLPRFSLSQQKLRDIELLLTGPSASIADNGAALTLPQLFERMNQAYNSGRAGFLEVDAAWKKLDDKMNAVVSFLKTRQGEAAGGIPEIRRMVEALRPKVISDPLGAGIEFDTQIEPRFQQARTIIEKLETQRHKLPANLALTKNMLRDLAALCDENTALLAECRDKIADFAIAEQPVPRQRISDLSGMLNQLERRAEAGAVDPVCLELESLAGEIQRLAQTAGEVRARNNAPLELRRELRGRLTALRAKAHAKGAAEDSRLVDLAQRAMTVLYAKPTPIDEASRLVQQYEARLNGRA